MMCLKFMFFLENLLSATGNDMEKAFLKTQHTEICGVSCIFVCFLNSRTVQRFAYFWGTKFKISEVISTSHGMSHFFAIFLRLPHIKCRARRCLRSEMLISRCILKDRYTNGSSAVSSSCSAPIPIIYELCRNDSCKIFLSKWSLSSCILVAVVSNVEEHDVHLFELSKFV